MLGLESTVVDARGACPVILRPGSITPAMIKAVCGDVAIDPAVLSKPEEGYVPSAPGQKYKHYAPKAKLTLFVGDKKKVADEINCRLAKEIPAQTGILCTDGTKARYPAGITLSLGNEQNPDEIGANLFKILRDFDALGVTKIFGEGFPEDREWLAVMNRLKKAAGYDIFVV
jgi:L-threonylcarbamoyladenylate synthase